MYNFLRPAVILMGLGLAGEFSNSLLPRVAAQQPANENKPQPDVLILVDDERLAGHFVGSNGTSVTFKSDVLGDVTVDWSKIKELHTQGQYAILPKNAQLREHQDTSAIPQGNLEVAGQKITITRPETAPTSVAVTDAAKVIDEPTFQKEVNPPPVPFTEAWTGTITAGASVVQATQESHTFTGTVNLVRAIPVDTDFPPRNRTSLNFSGSEGHVTQPGTAAIKTEIAHLDVERDQYFSPRAYGFAEAEFDHNYSQGLTLQQNYGGGIGWTVIRNPNETLDLKASMQYLRQQFQSGPDQDLIGSTFAETFTRKFAKGITFTEGFNVTPAWNNLDALLASANANLTMPVYKRFSFTLSATDSYLHNPPVGFKKNSFTATTGLSYSLK